MQKFCFLFFISAVLLFGCKQQKTEVEEPDVESIRKEIKPTEVETALAVRRPFEYRVNSSGTIASANELKITFRGNGILENLKAANGLRMRKGALLAELENDKEELAVQKAIMARDNAQVEFESDSIAYGVKLSPKIKTNLMLRSGLGTAKLNLQEARINLENTKVLAPISGVLAEIEQKQGNVVSSGEELGIIYDPDNLEMTGKILETDFKFIQKGLKADIFPLSFPDQSFSATVVEYNPKVDENGMITVKLRLDQTKGLLPGMNANAVIRVPQQENIIVPREALVMKSGKPVVFTYEGGLAKWKYVELGLDNGVDLEIKAGLEDGSTVIISNNLQLAHDAKVSNASTLSSN